MPSLPLMHGMPTQSRGPLAEVSPQSAPWVPYLCIFQIDFHLSQIGQILVLQNKLLTFDSNNILDGTSSYAHRPLG